MGPDRGPGQQRKGDTRVSKSNFRIPLALGATVLLAGGIAACGGSSDSGSSSNLSGNIRIDGSSTVAPLTEAIAEGF